MCRSSVYRLHIWFRSYSIAAHTTRIWMHVCNVHLCICACMFVLYIVDNCVYHRTELSLQLLYLWLYYGMMTVALTLSTIRLSFEMMRLRNYDRAVNAWQTSKSSHDVLEYNSEIQRKRKLES